MNCDYCGNALHPDALTCAGCGSARTTPLSDPAATVYERIGRAVVNREPNAALDELLGLGERENASTREQKIARAAKVLFVLFVLWQFPIVLMPILGFGMIFLFWIYLPYLGLKRLLGWIAS